MSTVRTTLEDVAAIGLRIERPLEAIERLAEPYAEYEVVARILELQQECKRELATLRSYVKQHYGPCEAARKKQGKRERVIEDRQPHWGRNGNGHSVGSGADVQAGPRAAETMGGR